MADIFQEIDEELRRDRASALWAKYGIYVIGVALALVLATAAWAGWRHYQTTARLEAGDRFTAAMLEANQGKTEAAVAGFGEIASNGPESYALLARMQGASLKVRAGDGPGAVSIYDAVAADSKAPEVYRNAALLLSVMLQVDSGDPKALSDRLSPIAGDDSPWRHSAREVQALLAIRAGDRAGARKILEGLSKDAGAPQSLRARATEMVLALGGGAES